MDRPSACMLFSNNGSVLLSATSRMIHRAEFTGNNQPSESTGRSLFFVNHGHDPLWEFNFPLHEQPGILEKRNASQQATGFEGQARDPASKFKGITAHIQADILRAQYKHPDQAGRKRRPAPASNVGDQV